MIDYNYPEQLIRGEELARILNISRSHAYKLMKTNTIPTVRIGRSVRVRLSDLNEWIDDNVHRSNDGLR